MTCVFCKREGSHQLIKVSKILTKVWTMSFMWICERRYKSCFIYWLTVVVWLLPDCSCSSRESYSIFTKIWTGVLAQRYTQNSKSNLLNIFLVLKFLPNIYTMSHYKLISAVFECTMCNRITFILYSATNCAINISATNIVLPTMFN